MRKTLILFVAAILALSGSCPVLATTENSNPPASVVSSISLTGEGSCIKWTTEGTSARGFKVVWSKNENPTYPTREGDKYHYYSEPTKNSDTLTAFSGAGTYYVRVCEYLGGACGKYSNQISVTLGGSESKPETTTTNASSVKSISLSKGDGNNVKWSVDGYSKSGFKVVWSKSENPTYPTRGGDKYHYYSCPTTVNDVLKAFDGSGVYYVRVCEYLGGTCGIYSNQIEVNLNTDPVKNTEGETIANPTVSAIILIGSDNNVKWTTTGYSPKGFKVVWSKNENPTYPTREGDKYHYRGEAGAASDWLEPFNGNGAYYVRVCEYKGGACGVYSNQIKVEMANATEKGVQQITEIREKANDLYNNKFDVLLAEIKSLKDIIKEQQVQINHLMKLKEGIYEAISSAVEDAIKNFIAYGVDDNTKKLGEGERAAVMYSYKAAFDKLPTTEEEMEDAIKIANGRWPSIMNDEAEKSAKEQFAKIYKREADMNNAHDAAAVKIMAYGLRQQAKNRNLNSEANALKIFKAIFKKIPQTTEEWNALQAITYSGAVR